MVFHKPNQIKTETIKRYFFLSFNCLNIECNSRLKLKELGIDFMGYFYCPDCNGKSFNLRKEKTNKQKTAKHSIVLIENSKVRGIKNGLRD